MEWQVIVALVLAIPILLIPVALIWYINIGGIMLAVKETRKRRVAQEKETREIVTATREK